MIDEKGVIVPDRGPHVGLAFVAMDMMHTRTALDLVRMSCYETARGADLGLFHASRTILADGRNEAVRDVLESGCTHVLFIDSDMRFPPNLLERLLSWDAPVVAANCAKRRRPTAPTARTVNFDGDEAVTLWPDPDEHGLKQVHSVGTGIMLIHRDVFDVIGEPWFSYQWRPEQKKHVGEDIWFCSRCHEVGIPIFVDQGASWHVRHTGLHDYSMQDTLAERAAAEDVGPAKYMERVPA